jgi:hypothetical protein
MPGGTRACRWNPNPKRLDLRYRGEPHDAGVKMHDRDNSRTERFRSKTVTSTTFAPGTPSIESTSLGLITTPQPKDLLGKHLARVLHPSTDRTAEG